MAFQIKETLLWILDDLSRRVNGEEEYQKNIDFVHSLGLKCDCVGWCKTDLSDNNTDYILARIEEFCKENKWRARGFYTRNMIDTDSQWYRLCADDFKETETLDSAEEINCTNGDFILLNRIKACNIAYSGIKDSYFIMCVPEKFRNAYIENNMSGLKFCWLQDKGKYAGTQYFAVEAETRISRMMCDDRLEYDISKPAALRQLPQFENIQLLGGKLTDIVQLFTTLRIDLANCYLTEDMPDAQFAYGYIKPTRNTCRKYDLLIRKDAVQQLLNAKVLTEKQIEPVCISDTPIPGYTIMPTVDTSFPSDDVLDERIKSYLNLLSKDRPKKLITEKFAAKILRSAKKQRPEDFKKALSKRKKEQLLNTEYEVLLPYYSICESGYLSDEYNLISYDESLALTKEFIDEIQKDETADLPTEGIIIAECADGDKILLTHENKVYRISHEEPVIIGQWNTPADFIGDVTE